MGKINTRQNVQSTMEGTVLVIRVETDPALVTEERSASGKSMVVATTGGAIKVNGLSINLTVYHK